MWILRIRTRWERSFYFLFFTFLAVLVALLNLNEIVDRTIIRRRWCCVLLLLLKCNKRYWIERIFQLWHAIISRYKYFVRYYFLLSNAKETLKFFHRMQLNAAYRTCTTEMKNASSMLLSTIALDILCV